MKTRNLLIGSALALLAAKEAFKQAADPNCFPEQLATLGLKVCNAKKLYAIGTDPKTSVLNANNQVWWGKRVREHSWQFPQGGIFPT